MFIGTGSQQEEDKSPLPVAAPQLTEEASPMDRVRQGVKNMPHNRKKYG